MKVTFMRPHWGRIKDEGLSLRDIVILPEIP